MEKKESNERLSQNMRLHFLALVKTVSNCILETIEYFNKYAKYLANDRFPIDRSRFDGLHNAWYMTIVNSDSKIDEHQEPVLKAQLKSAYIATLRILMTRAAKHFIWTRGTYITRILAEYQCGLGKYHTIWNLEFQHPFQQEGLQIQKQER